MPKPVVQGLPLKNNKQFPSKPTPVLPSQAVGKARATMTQHVRVGNLQKKI